MSQVEIASEWGVDVADLEDVSQSSARVHFQADPMDDTLTLTVSVPSASTDDGRLPDGYPHLLLTARRKGMYTYIQSYALFPDRYFFRKGKGKTIRIRFDRDPAIDCLSDTADLTSLCNMQWSVPYQRLLDASSLLVRILPGIGNGVTSTFQLDRCQSVVRLFLQASLGPEYESIARLHPRIVETVACFGPQNTVLKKTVLKELGYLSGEIDTTKGFEFYEAAERFATAVQSFEITGTGIDLQTRKFHKPWTIELSERATADVRSRMGPLMIGD